MESTRYHNYMEIDEIVRHRLYVMKWLGMQWMHVQHLDSSS